MAFLTLYKLAEQTFNLLEGGDPATASSVDFNTLKLACCQVINRVLKIDYFSINLKMGELIPNGSVLGLYENIVVTSMGAGTSKSKATLPIKPLKLPRNMGVFSVWLEGEYEKEFIPLQMGQSNLLKSQPLINDLLGQVGYEVFGDKIIFTKDLTTIFPDKTVSMRLAIMDVNQYGDYDILPLPPEYEPP